MYCRPKECRDAEDMGGYGCSNFEAHARDEDSSDCSMNRLWKHDDACDALEVIANETGDTKTRKLAMETSEDYMAPRTS